MMDGTSDGEQARVYGSAALLHLFGPVLTRSEAPATCARLGRAEGSLTVNGEEIELRNAYARAERDAVGAPAYHVVLSDVPLHAAVLNDDQELSRRARAGSLHYLRLRIRADGAAVSTELRHTGLGALGYVIDLGGSAYRFVATVLNPRYIAGQAFMEAPAARHHHSWSYEVRFAAPVAKGGRWS